MTQCSVLGCKYTSGGPCQMCDKPICDHHEMQLGESGCAVCEDVGWKEENEMIRQKMSDEEELQRAIATVKDLGGIDLVKISTWVRKVRKDALAEFGCPNVFHLGIDGIIASLPTPPGHRKPEELTGFNQEDGTGR